MRPKNMLVVVAVCAALGMLAGRPAVAGVDEWTSNGPYGGQISAMAIDPITPSTLYAGTRGGVFRSTDSASNWAPARNGLPANANVRELAVDPQTPTTVYAAGTFGVYKSIDAGAHWTAANDGFLATFVGALAIDPQTPSTLYAATISEIYKSTDAGAHWALVSEGLPSGIFIQSLVIDPQTPATLYVAAFEGLFKTTDGGAHWSAIGNGSLPNPVWTLAIDPHTPSTLYAGSDDSLTGETRVYRSFDGGQNWSATQIIPYPNGVFALAVDPQTPGKLYAIFSLNIAGSTFGIFRSVDGGDSWDIASVGPPTLALVIDPQVATTLYAVTSEGPRRSTDSGDTWSTMNDGIAATSVDALAVDPRNPDTLYAGAGEGVFRSLDGGDSWGRVDQDLPPIAAIHDLVIHPSTPSTMYLNATVLFTDISVDLVFRSLDGGARWRFIDNGIPPEISHGSLVIDPLTSTTLYLATRDAGVFKTTDGGNLWFPVNQGLTDVNFAALAIDPLTPATLYAGGRTELSKSTDAGASWQDISVGLPEVQGSLDVDLLTVDPRTPATVYAYGAFGLAKSVDGGVGWVQVGDGLSGMIEVLVVDPENSSTLYAGGRDGVFLSLDGGNLWAALNEGLAVTSVSSLAMTSAASSTLYAGTHGGGVVDIQRLSGREVLSLQGGRFTVEVDWRDFQGAAGTGKVAVVSEETADGVLLRSSDSAVTQFFSPDNWELLAKVLDGRALNGHHWVFLSAATNVELTTTVTDTSCGVTRTYVNPLGEAAPAVTDVTAFSDCADPSPPSCVENASAVCLGEGGRFRVETSYRDFFGIPGDGQTVSIPTSGLAKSDDSGLFYFFSDDNWELLIKVLDACGLNDHFWVFAAATTNVEYTITVTDTESDEVRTFTNPLGRAAEAITDTNAFATCSAR